MNRKVTVVGAGNVGATAAREHRRQGAGRRRDDRHRAGRAAGQGPGHPRSVSDRAASDSRVLGTNDYADTADSDVVVITAGMARKPGMSRDDLVNTNYKVMQQVTAQIVKHSPNCIIVPVTNPLDAMCQARLPRQRLPARARHRHGRRARLGAHAHVHRDSA